MNQSQISALRRSFLFRLQFIWAQLPEGAGEGAAAPLCRNCQDVDVVSGSTWIVEHRVAKILSVIQLESIVGHMVGATRLKIADRLCINGGNLCKLMKYGYLFPRELLRLPTQD